MIKRTIEISREPCYLSTKLDQIVIQPFERDKSEAKSIPCEDIGVVLIDHPQVTITHGALQTLMRCGVVVITCDRDHLPVGFMLPVSSHTEVVTRLNDQIAVSKPVQKQLWKQITIAKIKAQAKHIDFNQSRQSKLNRLATEVKSGDTSNVESQAARVYWQALREHTVAWKDFRRNQDGDDHINVFLNYGYAVMRAAVARAIVSGGFQPALGLHHCNRSNAFCLADDLIEPLRPIVDRAVVSMIASNKIELDQPAKACLLNLLVSNVEVASEKSPLMVALHRYVASLGRCYTKQSSELLIPTAWEADA